MQLLHWPTLENHTAINLGLTQILKLLANIDNPHLKLPPIIHVAGTNGKGSTIAYLKSILEAAGYKVHRYISPHLVNFNERITLAGQEINDAFLYEVIEECRLAAGNLQLTLFEASTAAAFLAFSRVKADILLLETGLGGRLDATNVIEAPVLALITPISLDHIEYLGHTIAQITQEKAGIIKNGSKCVISTQPQEAMHILKEHCYKQSVEYFAYNEHWHIHESDHKFTFQFQQHNWSCPMPSLYGSHQITNASTALAALQSLKNFNILKEDVDYGLTHTIWPGRLQRITEGEIYQKMHPESELWLDGAHNVAGAATLSNNISRMNIQKKLPLYLIHGRSKGRNIADFLEFFINDTTFLCATHIAHEPMSQNSKTISDTASQMGFEARSSHSLREAFDISLEHANNHPIRLVVCGSLYLLGDFFKKFSAL